MTGANSNGTAVEVTYVTATGAVTDSGQAETTFGPLTAPAGGGIAYAYSAGGVTGKALVSESPDPWTILPGDGTFESFRAVEVAAGETVEQVWNQNIQWVMAIVPST